MVQRKLRSGVRRGPRGAQAAARRLRTAAGRGALRWVVGPARRANRRLFDAAGHDRERGSEHVQAESSSVARQQGMSRERGGEGVQAESSLVARQHDMSRESGSEGVQADSSSVVRQHDMSRESGSEGVQAESSSVARQQDMSRESGSEGVQAECSSVARQQDRSRESGSEGGEAESSTVVRQQDMSRECGGGGVQAESSSVAREQDMSRFVTPFAGVSVFTDGKLSSSTRSVVDGGTASGYHLLVVDGYSQTKNLPNGVGFRSRPFIVGGHHWCIDCLPNGLNSSCEDCITLFVVLLDEDVAKAVKVWFRFSFVDEVEKQELSLVRAADICNFRSGDQTWGVARFVKRDVLEQSKNLKNDCFTIRFDIMICKDLSTEDAGATQVPLSGISQHFNHLLQTKVGADLTFEVCGETFAAHRCVLAAQSTVFMAQLFGSPKEGTKADVIQIKEMKAQVFKVLLSYIYTGAFPEMEQEGGVVRLQWLEDLIVAADRYDLKHLRFSCEELLSELIDAKSVPKILDLAVEHHCHRLKENCMQLLQNQSSSSLRTLMTTNSWKLMILAYPYVLHELNVKLAKCNASDNATISYQLLLPPFKN